MQVTAEVIALLGDAGTILAPFVGLALTAVAILRDTRSRLALLRVAPSSGAHTR